jgi:uncharacterized protein YebE (UPF0316 family)
MELLLGSLFIFGARIIDVSLGTIRMLMLMRGKKYHAAFIGFFEVIVFIKVLGMVVNQLDNPVYLIMYGLGFAAGNIVGGILEERLAVGFLTLHIISKNKSKQLTEVLRGNGYGVTVIDSHGWEGERDILNLQIKRKDVRDVQRLISTTDSNAYVTIYDTREALGGYFKRSKKK